MQLVIFVVLDGIAEEVLADSAAGHNSMCELTAPDFHVRFVAARRVVLRSGVAPRLVLRCELFSAGRFEHFEVIGTSHDCFPFICARDRIVAACCDSLSLSLSRFRYAKCLPKLASFDQWSRKKAQISNKGWA
jgi:hypothetical protein